MIARVFEPSRSFARTCYYVTQDQTRARVLWEEGVRGYDHRLMASDFEIVASLHDTISKPVFHAALTFHPNEVLDEERKVELGLKYLDGVGMVNTQRLIAEHHDARHQHLHLVANRIDYDGEPIHNFPEVLKSRDTVERLTREYDLVPVRSKDLRQTNFDALDRSDTRKYVVYRAIRDCLGEVRSMDGLEERLGMDGIEIRYRLDEAGQRIGVSFLYQNEAFRGSEIDRRFSLGGLERAVSQRQELSIWEAEKLVLGNKVWQEEERVLKEKEVLRQQEILAEAQRLEQMQGAKLGLEKKEEELKEDRTLREARRTRWPVGQEEEKVAERHRRVLRLGRGMGL